MTKSPLVTQQVSICAAWSGAHLSSQSCVQYGITEIEAAFNMPQAGGGIQFFGNYLFACQGPDGSAYNGAGNCDPSWNEIDIAFQNVSGVGMTYGTSLFISKSQTSYTSPFGFSNNSALGAFSTHAATGCINPTSGCVLSPTDPGSCPAAPLDFAQESITARQAGVRQGTAGGGCPIYTNDQAINYHNYKLVWTPNWLAWMIDGRVMRNETADVRTGYVPWRAMQLRPLLRTASGSVPTITGTCPAGATLCTPGANVTVPAGLIQTMAGQLVANNNISLHTMTASVTITSNGMADYIFKAGSACNPCNLLSVMPTVLGTVVITNAVLNYAPNSNAYIRRIKYTPFSASNIATAISTDQSFTWGPSPVTGAPLVATPVTPWTPPAAPYYAAAATLYVAGFSANSFPETSFPQALANGCLDGIPTANITIIAVNNGASESINGALDSAVTVSVVVVVGSLNQLTELFIQLDYCTVADLQQSLGPQVTDVSLLSGPVSVSNPSSLVPASPSVTAPPTAYTSAATTSVSTAASMGGITSSTPLSAVQYALAASLGIPVAEVQITSFTTTPASGRHLSSVKSKPAAQVKFTTRTKDASHASSVAADLKGGNTLERIRTNWASAHASASGRRLTAATPEDLTNFRLTSEPATATLATATTPDVGSSGAYAAAGVCISFALTAFIIFTPSLKSVSRYTSRFAQKKVAYEEVTEEETKSSSTSIKL